MKKFLPLVIFLTCTVIFTACSTIPKWERTIALSPELLDAKMKEFVPSGPMLIEIKYDIVKSKSTLSGYIDFGTSVDGEDCEFDLVSTTVSEKADERYELRRASENSFARRTNSKDSTRQDINKWYDKADPSWPGSGIIFAPEFITDGRPIASGGGDAMCTWKFLDRVATFEPSTNTVKIDTAKAQTLLNVGMELYTEKFLRAVGASEQDINKYGPSYMRLASPTFKDLLSKTVLKAERDGDTIVYTQTFDGSAATLVARFTPTESRDIMKVDEVTYFEKLSRDPEAKNWRKYLEKIRDEY